MIYLGTSRAAIADTQVQAVKTQIDNKLKPSQEATWDQLIAPQLASRGAQIAQEAAEAARIAQEQAKPAPVRSVQPVAGTCAEWMQAAGISDMQNAYTLIMRESGCNPNAVNASSGSCGIGQQLPCGKWPHQWNDPVGAMIDMQNYVYGRYGSWANALAHSYANNWY